MSNDAVSQVAAVAGNYSNLEYDLNKGERGTRHKITEVLLKELTGSEAAMVVNNNAAAVFLILRTFAKQKEVVISRGELIEIGGAFRISSIMEESDAILKEVGTTNRTHLYDYEQAINKETAILMKVHQSNFKTIGFTHAISTKQLVNLAKKYHQPLIYEDLGSGSLYDFKMGNEPVVSKVIETGVDLVSFSGDKLIGGPQAGIIIGKKELINKLKRHQLTRVLRVDKMTLAALEATLGNYLREEFNNIPTIRDISLPICEIEKRIMMFTDHFNNNDNKWIFKIENSASQVGGGAMPGIEIPTLVLAVKHLNLDSHTIHSRLRQGTSPIIARLKKNHVLLDFRTITTEDIPIIVEVFKKIE
ncbi:L-seryl-tRNA(Sec) selenium transferase [Lentibacillus populi]|uniref:L-seryl-tRNA(Sec) selenium transferase n=1 Tax=Lentibacillus populi TaxID=1827502 RepID=A0A9W5X5K2_9BACI|nr:L-seryl-tRNA(Sec) selenium transferase [Lentibacillus populi]